MIFAAIKADKEDIVLALLNSRKFKHTSSVDGPRGDISGPQNIFVYACNNHRCHNILDKLVTEKQMQKAESGEVYWMMNRVVEEYLSYGLSESIYVKCINKIVDLAAEKGIPASAVIEKYKPSAELRMNGTHYLLDLSMKNGYWPCWADDGLSKKKADVLYGALKQAIENKMYLDNDIGDVISTGITICKAAKQPISILSDIITNDYIIQSSPWEIYSAIRDSLYNPELISKIMKLRSSFDLDDESCNALILDLLNNKIKNEESKKCVLRLLRTYKDNYSLDNEVLEIILKKKDMAMFELFVDLGFTNQFLQYAKLPPKFTKYLEDNGVDLEGDYEYEDPHNKQHQLKVKKRIIQSIIEDTWNTALDDELKKRPELLEDPTILEVIENNLQKSFTARDLKKRFVKDKAPDDVYEM